MFEDPRFVAALVVVAAAFIVALIVIERKGNRDARAVLKESALGLD